MTTDDASLPNFLRAWRKRKGMTQEALASEVGLTSGAISQFETGKSNFTIPTLIDLAEALGCRPGDILSYSPKEIHGKVEGEENVTAHLQRIAIIPDGEAWRSYRSIMAQFGSASETPSETPPHDLQQPANRRRAKEPS